MVRITGSERIVETLSALDRQELSEDDALVCLGEVLRENLDAFQAPANVQNAGQVGNLLYAHIVPSNVLASGLLSRFHIGAYPALSPKPAEANSIEKGVVVLLSWLKGSSEMGSLKSPIQQLMTHLGRGGHVAQAADLAEAQDRAA